MVLVLVTGFLFLGVGPSGVLSTPPMRARFFPLLVRSGVGDITTSLRRFIVNCSFVLFSISLFLFTVQPEEYKLSGLAMILVNTVTPVPDVFHRNWNQGGHIPAKIKFPVLDNFSLCYFYVINNS